MALTIDAQYLQFVQFAQQQDNAIDSNEIARAGAEGGLLGGRTIVAATGDGLRKLKRSNENRRENDAARALFRQSIVNMFGSEGNIPESVRQAMRLQDYGAGRPLTARRIMAVKAAMDVYVRRAVVAFDQAKANAGALYTGRMGAQRPQEERDRIDGLLSTAVYAAVRDEDALGLVVSLGRQIVRRGDGALRTPDQVKERVAGLVANCEELRSAAGGNPEILRAGRAFLLQLGGKPLPDGMVRSLVRLVMKQRIDRIRGLSPASSIPQLHDAVKQLIGNIHKGMSAPGVTDALPDWEQKNALRVFLTALQLARCSDAAARNVKALLDDKGALLDCLYGAANRAEFDHDDLPAGRVDHVRELGLEYFQRLEALYHAAQERIGVPEEQIRMFDPVRDLDYGNEDNIEVLQDFVDLGADVAEQQRADFLKDAVAGAGRGAAKVRGAFGRFLPPDAFEPKRLFKEAREANIRGMVNLSFCRNAKAMAGNISNSRFRDDLILGLRVKLPDGRTLPNANFDEALDMLASFLTRGGKTTYAALDQSEKNRLAVLVSLLSHDAADIGRNGGLTALDPHGRTPPIVSDGEDAKREFSLSIDPNGNLEVVCKTEQTIEHLGVRNEQGRLENVAPRAGSRIEAHYSVRISAGELDRLAGVDFSKFDDSQAQGRIDDPQAESPYRTIDRTLGNDYCFAPNGVVFDSVFKMTVN